MSTFFHRGNEAATSGELPALGTQAPDFRLTGIDLKDIVLSDFRGSRIVLNIFPSVDTSTCATSVRKFNQMASSLHNTKVICISRDLPFAFRRFCGAEGIENVISASEFRDHAFSENYGVEIISGSTLVGLMCRAIVVINESGVVVHTELVQDLSTEPNYEAAIVSIS
ncbi:MAG: thiol peroxidase [Flavobacteriales bacterium]